MPKFTVQIAETRNYQIEVEATDAGQARVKAWDVWQAAPEVGGYEIPDQETDIVAVTAKD